MTERPLLSLVIPMYNEEENIEHALATARNALESDVGSWEIIVVNDASTDRSPELVQELAKQDASIRMISHERNRRLGATLRTGFAAASGDVILYMDADLPFDPVEIARGLRAMEITRCDVVAGYRHDRTSEGFRRTAYSFLYNFLIGALFRWPHRDINFSFKLLRREGLDALELESEGSLIDAEIIVKARNLGFTIQQIGLDYFPRTRGTSTLSSPSVILTIFSELRRLRVSMKHPRDRRRP